MPKKTPNRTIKFGDIKEMGPGEIPEEILKEMKDE